MFTSSIKKIIKVSDLEKVSEDIENLHKKNGEKFHHNLGLIHDQELIDERCLKATQEELKMLQKLNLTLAYPRNYYVNQYIRNGKKIWLCSQCISFEDKKIEE